VSGKQGQLMGWRQSGRAFGKEPRKARRGVATCDIVWRGREARGIRPSAQRAGRRGPRPAGRAKSVLGAPAFIMGPTGKIRPARLVEAR